MKLITIEVPYTEDKEADAEYARRAVADSLARGEAPIMSHLLYMQPGILDSSNPEQLAQGVEAARAWGSAAHETVLYCDRGITVSMDAATDRAHREGRSVTQRTIGS